MIALWAFVIHTQIFAHCRIMPVTPLRGWRIYSSFIMISLQMDIGEMQTAIAVPLTHISGHEPPAYLPLEGKSSCIQHNFSGTIWILWPSFYSRKPEWLLFNHLPSTVFLVSNATHCNIFCTFFRRDHRLYPGELAPQCDIHWTTELLQNINASTSEGDCFHARGRQPSMNGDGVLNWLSELV